MADVTIEAAAYNALNYRAVRVGPVWTDEDTAYVFYINAAEDLVYRKTVDGGANWAAAVSVKEATVEASSIWFDKWTPGDAGTKIHISYIESDSDDVLYRRLDTATDILSDEVIIFNGASAAFSSAWNARTLDITKARGGNLYCGFWIDNDAENGFYRSTDGGANWTARTTMADGVAVDLILLEPGDEADTNDIWCFYWDASANEISLKVYDDSGNSWGETAIGGSMAESAEYYQMSAAQRASDNHVILAAWSQLNNAASDLMVWDIGGDGVGEINAKANVLTDTPEAAQCAVFINQQNDDIYVAYLKGTDWTTLVRAFYKKSIDGGANWGNETALSVDAEDDHRAIWAGHSVGDEGGYFMPCWFDDDDNDLFTNTANAIAIAAAGGAPQTLTPDPAVAIAAVPSPVLGLVYSLAPTPVVAPAVVPTSQVDLMLKILLPTSVVAEAVVPSPVLSLTRTLIPDSIVAPAAVPSPVLSLSRTLTPDSVSALAAVPSPTITQGSTLAPTPTVAQAVVPSPAMALELALTPNPVIAQAIIPSPVLAPENVLAPSPVAASVVVPSPALSLVLTFTPDPVIATAMVPEPDIAIGGVITLQPIPVVAVAVIPVPVLTQGTLLVPTSTIAQAVVPSSAISSVLTLTPDPVVAPATVSAPVLATSLTLLPTPVIATAAVPSLMLALAKVLLPTPVLALAVVPEPKIDILLYILNPMPIVSVAVVPAPILSVEGLYTQMARRGSLIHHARVIDARCDDAINSGDATTDGVIDALRDAMIAHGLIAPV